MIVPFIPISPAIKFYIYNITYCAFRVCSSSLLRATTARIPPALFQKIFKFCTFLPKFSDILSFLNIILTFSKKLHACSDIFQNRRICIPFFILRLCVNKTVQTTHQHHPWQSHFWVEAIAAQKYAKVDIKLFLTCPVLLDFFIL